MLYNCARFFKRFFFFAYQAILETPSPRGEDPARDTIIESHEKGAGAQFHVSAKLEREALQHAR